MAEVPCEVLFDHAGSRIEHDEHVEADVDISGWLVDWLPARAKCELPAVRAEPDGLYIGRVAIDR